MEPHIFEANRAAWNARTPYHVRSRFYDVPAFEAGADALTPIESAQLGDVRGRSLLHLQCHFGLDTLSLVRRGAIATGLDLSDVAIAEARALAARTGLAARFVEGNVYDAPALTGARYDVVFTSWGVLGWLPDLAPWARAVAGCLAPGGRFHLVEFHPLLSVWDDAFERVAYRYDGGAPIVEENRGSYADRAAPIAPRTYWFNHGIATIVGSLLAAGLELVALTEHDWVPYDVFTETDEFAPGRYRLKRFGDRLPLALGLVARPR
jgi:SAM-dependent methyltransferase